MHRIYGLVFAAGLLIAPASRAQAQVAVSVGYPAYYGYYGAPAYVYPATYGGYYGGYGVSINVPGFSYSSGYYPPAYAAPVVATYSTRYYAPYYSGYAPYYGVSAAAPSFYYSGYSGYVPGVRVRVGY
jgi:hypothetical protein